MPLRPLLFALALIAAAPVGRADDANLKLYTTQGSFENVIQDVELAITARGLFVDHRQHISDMLERTGRDLGMTKKVYARAETLQFCSAVLSRKMMEADPANIVYCPYIIVLYTLPGDPQKVHVGYRRPPQGGASASGAALREVETLLDGIVREALDLR